MSNVVHVLVPHGFDDPARPSGGNHYDRRIIEGLTRLGWQVQIWRVPHCWPAPDPRSSEAVVEVIAALPDNAVVLVDGLIASALPEAFVAAARRVRLVVLVHMPFDSPAVLGDAKAVITTAHWTRANLPNKLPNVHVAQPGTDAAPLANPEPGGHRLLCVAAVAEHKGHDTLFGALERVLDLPWHCTIVGALDREPAFVDRLREQFAHLLDRVTFTGVLAGDDLAQAYATADLFVFASRGEAYGMVLCEALARGIPVLSANVGGIAEAVGKADDGTVPGVLVGADDASALATELTRWLTDPELRDRLRNAATNRRDSLPTWQTTTRQVADVLAEVAT